MEKNYEKEVVRIIDAVKNVDCVNCSIGALNRLQFSWIINNLEQFKKESIIYYCKIIASVVKFFQGEAYYIIYEEKDVKFTLTEKHLGVWKNFNKMKKQMPPTYYLSDNKRYSYVSIENLENKDLSVLCNGILVFLSNEIEINRCMENMLKENDVFNCFYNEGYLIAAIRDLWSDGNALTFYSQDTELLNKIFDIAKEHGFIMSN